MLSFEVTERGQAAKVVLLHTVTAYAVGTLKYVKFVIQCVLKHRFSDGARSTR